MSEYVIIVDTTCDLSPEMREYFGVDDYMKYHVHFDDGKDFPGTLDWSPMPRDVFYKYISGKSQRVSTSPPSEEEYFEYYKAYAEKGVDIINMSISSATSGSFAINERASRRIAEKYPKIKIHCVNTMRMSAGYGLIAAYAFEMKKNGKSFDEVVDWIESNKMRVHQMGPIDDLITVARRGRITMGKAIMGSFAGVKPMGDCNSDGYVTVLTKAKGIKKALELTVRYIGETADNIGDGYVFISHSDREVYANDLKTMIDSALRPKKTFVTDVYFGCGPNIGPGMVCAYYLGAPITDLSAEKEIMSKLCER